MGRPFNALLSSFRIRWLAVLMLAVCLAFMIGRSSSATQDRRFPHIDSNADPDKPVSRLYDVSDIISAAAEYMVTRPTLPVRQQNYPHDSERPTQKLARSEAEWEMRNELIDLIPWIVVQDSWKINGGTYGDLRSFGPNLLITQTPDVHRRILEFLIVLRSPPHTSNTAELRTDATPILQPTTSKDASNAYVVVYDVHSILEQAADQAIADFNSGPPFSENHNRLPRGIYADNGRLEVLIQLIEALTNGVVATVLPKTWETNGGDEGRLWVLGHRIIIRQTREAHTQIERLLKDLEKQPGASSFPPATREAP